MRMLMTAGLLTAMLPATVLAQELVGEWSNDPDNCDEMRIIYRENGEHPTEVNADGDWVVVNESTWERAGDVVYVTTEGRTEAWDIEHLDEERAHLVNQDPAADELGAGEREIHRCPPR